MKPPIDYYNDLDQFLRKVDTTFDLELSGGVYLRFSNSGKRGGETKCFNLGMVEVLAALNDIKKHRNDFAAKSNYEEKPWRDLGAKYFTDEVTRSFITVQTKPVFTLFSKIIHWANELGAASYSDGHMDLSTKALDKTIEVIQEMVESLSPSAIALQLEKDVPDNSRPLGDFDFSRFREDFKTAITKARFIQTE